jgi:hypothetical protein
MALRCRERAPSTTSKPPLSSNRLSASASSGHCWWAQPYHRRRRAQEGRWWAPRFEQPRAASCARQRTTGLRSSPWRLRDDDGGRSLARQPFRSAGCWHGSNTGRPAAVFDNHRDRPDHQSAREAMISVDRWLPSALPRNPSDDIRHRERRLTPNLVHPAIPVQLTAKKLATVNCRGVIRFAANRSQLLLGLSSRAT